MAEQPNLFEMLAGGAMFDPLGGSMAGTEGAEPSGATRQQKKAKAASATQQQRAAGVAPPKPYTFGYPRSMAVGAADEGEILRRALDARDEAILSKMTNDPNVTAARDARGRVTGHDVDTRTGQGVMRGMRGGYVSPEEQARWQPTPKPVAEMPPPPPRGEQGALFTEHSRIDGTGTSRPTGRYVTNPDLRAYEAENAPAGGGGGGGKGRGRTAAGAAGGADGGRRTMRDRAKGQLDRVRGKVKTPTAAGAAAGAADDVAAAASRGGLRGAGAGALKGYGLSLIPHMLADSQPEGSMQRNALEGAGSGAIFGSALQGAGIGGRMGGLKGAAAGALLNVLTEGGAQDFLGRLPMVGGLIAPSFDDPEMEPYQRLATQGYGGDPEDARNRMESFETMMMLGVPQQQAARMAFEGTRMGERLASQWQTDHERMARDAAEMMALMQPMNDQMALNREMYSNALQSVPGAPPDVQQFLAQTMPYMNATQDDFIAAQQQQALLAPFYNDPSQFMGGGGGDFDAMLAGIM
jgi:hypothetical protein